MSKVLKVIKSPNLIAAIIILLLICVAYFVGPIFGLSLMIRIGISVCLLFILAILILYNKLKAAQKAGQLEKSISSQADDQMQNLSPEKKAEIDQFKKQLESAIKSLKNSKLGKGKLGKSALYTLPWYLIIGPPAAGKTTAIQKSGLDFPFGKDSFKGVGGTRNCDWFFSTKGIFLDTAGRYVISTEDTVEWYAFLETLKKYRSRKPINGILIALNIDEIINAGKNELSEHAKNIRQKLDELIEKLGINFPVYFIFTKCDLIQGFVEFFGDLSEIERSQIWGATLFAVQNPKETFESEFDLLSDKLFRIRSSRLSSPLKREYRRKIFLFPYQFQSLKKKLSYLIGELFQPNPYMDNPIFRGFYFTSGTQEGIPLDIAIKEIASKFNLPPFYDPEKPDNTEVKNYFIKDLLNDVVIGDQNYHSGEVSFAVKKETSMRFAVIGISVFFLFLFSFFSYSGYNGSNSTLDKIKLVSASFAGIDWNRDLLNNFTKAEEMRSLIVNIENGDANESFISFGMDRSDATLEELKQLYFKKTESFFTRNIYEELERNLNLFSQGNDYSGDVIYNYLKSYLLIGNERARLDTSGVKYLSTIFTDILTSKYINSNPVASKAEKDSLKNLFRNFAVYFADHLSDKNAYRTRNDNMLVSMVRDRIQFKPNPETIYARLKQDQLAQSSSEMTFEQMAGYSTVVYSDLRIPGIFTADGWKNNIEGAINEESINPGKDDWVLGTSHIRSVADVTLSPDEMRNKLLGLYFNDYLHTWVEFIQSIGYKEFGNVPMTANSLKMLGDPAGSPLLNMLKVFSVQIKVISDLKTPPDSTNNFSQKYFSASSSLPDVQNYRLLIEGPPGGNGGDINKIIEQYAFLGGALDQIKDDPALIKDYAVKVLNKSAGEFQTASQIIKGVTRVQPLQRVLTEPLTLGWRAVLNDAANYLNVQWKAKVADFFSGKLANSFPFQKSSVDAPIQDFKDFFKPQDGILWSFFNKELANFINQESWKVYQWENQGIFISERLINSLKKAGDISATLFKTGELGFSFRLKPKLPDSKLIKGQKPFVEQVYLSIDGDDDYYRMGSPFWKDYFWPGNKGSSGAKMNLSIRNYGNSDQKSYDGEWALFKLFDQASSRSETLSQYELNWFFKKENYYNITVTYLLGLNSSRNPFSEDFFSSFTLPDKIN